MIITFIPIKTAHFPLLLQWLTTPQVKAWWDQDVEWTPALIEEKYDSYVHGYKIEKGIKKPLSAYIICVDHFEIGYIQLYNAHDFSREDDIELEELPQSLAAIDFFVGDQDFIGKGLGTKILIQFLKDYVDPRFEACFVDPDTANKQAIHAYEKAGFRKVKTIKNDTITWMIKKK